MTTPAFGFDQIMAPLGAARFFAEYEGQRPLHLEGAADKFAAVMSWPLLNQLLSQATIWTQHSLQLVLDKEPVPAQRYCAPAVGRDGGQVLRPDPGRVQRLLRQGATLVANDIDHLNPGLTAFARALERALGGKVQGNLYLSSRRRPGFAAHFDTHDVYAVHVEGTKTWQVYEGRAEDPIAHPAFKNLGREHHERAKGRKLMDVHMKPGDILYLPRGQYHDALADDGGAVHVAFGVTFPIGLDVMTDLFERVVAEPAFRANLPRTGGEALQAHLERLVATIAATMRAPDLIADIEAMQRGFRYPRHHYDLPGLLEVGDDERYRVRADGIRLVEQGGRFGLVRAGSTEATEVPAAVSPMVGWVLDRPEFSVGELAEAFPQQARAELDRLLIDLGNMRLTEPV